MAHKRDHENVSLTKDEAKKVGDVALVEGAGPDEVASGLVQAAIARRMRKRTGKSPARVISFSGGTPRRK